jgi:serine/threonine protein kinase
VRSIGAGGIADVFLYDQQHPSRPVAVKVLRAEHVNDESVRQFANEADVMAQVQYTRTDVDQSNEARNSDGAGTRVDHNMNMPEGAKITFRVCLVDGKGAPFGCGAFKTATA